MTTSVETAPLIDLQQLLAGARWRARLWLSTGLIGLLLGAASAVALPSVTAVAGVLVAHELGTNPQVAVLTDSTLAQSTAVAGAALRKLDSPIPAAKFVSSYGASSLKSGQVLSFTLRARTEEEALRRLQAVVDAYREYHVGLAKERADAEAQALIERRARIEAQLQELDRSIAQRTEAATLPGRAHLADRTAFEAEIRRTNQQLEEVTKGIPAVAAGTRIVDGPRLQTSLTSAAVMNSAIGSMLGLALGGLLALIATVARDRPVLRREIAANLGASVIAQLPTRRRWIALRSSLRRAPAQAESERVASTLGRLLGRGTASLSLLELGCAPHVAALVADVAGGLAADSPVLVIDDLPGRDVTRLLSTDARFRIADGAGELPQPSQDEVKIGVGSVQPGTSWTDLTRLGERTVLVVAAGFARTEWLHTVARQLADLGIQVIGVVVVNPDPRDRTDGTLWDALHSALRAHPGTLKRGNSLSGDHHDKPSSAFTPVGSSDSHNGHPA